MGRMQGVADQDDVVVVVALVAHAGEAAPDRVVGDQWLAAQMLGEDALAMGDGVGLAGLVQAGPAPCLLGAFDDEGRHAGGVAVAVGAPQPMLVLFEIEGEGVELAAGAQPDELVRAHHDIGAEGFGVLGADERVDAVAGDDQIGLGEGVEAGDIGIVDDLDPQLGGALLQDLQQGEALHAGEAVPGRGGDGLAVMDVDIVPMNEGVGDGRVGLGIGITKAAHGFVGEHHAEAPGDVWRPALEDAQRPLGMRLLDQQGEIQRGGTASDTNDFHASCPYAHGGRTRAPPGPPSWDFLRDIFYA